MNINLYPAGGSKQEIVPGKRFREWMSPHAYRCLPLTSANTLGWDIILGEEVVAEWNGGPNKNDVTIISGHGTADAHFGLGTLTIAVGYTWHTEPGVQLMVMPVPNSDMVDLQTLTAVVETDVLKYPWFLSLRCIREGRVTIPAGTPIARVLPIRIADVENTKLVVKSEPADFREDREHLASERKENNGPWTKIYHGKANYTKIRTPAMEIDGEDSIKHLANNGVFTQASYLTVEECTTLIDYCKNNEPTYQSDEYWKDRAYSFNQDTFGADVYHKLTSAIEKTASDWYGQPLKLRDSHLVEWKEGHEMRPHSDWANGEYPLRDYAAVLYLNDDYEGGELFIPTLDIEIAPSAGALVMLPGGTLFHGVRKVTKGQRYTCIGWLQSDLADTSKVNGD